MAREQANSASTHTSHLITYSIVQFGIFASGHGNKANDLNRLYRSARNTHSTTSISPPATPSREIIQDCTISSKKTIFPWGNLRGPGILFVWGTFIPRLHKALTMATQLAVFLPQTLLVHTTRSCSGEGPSIWHKLYLQFSLPSSSLVIIKLLLAVSSLSRGLLNCFLN